MNIETVYYTGYRPLDRRSPVDFDGRTVTWDGHVFELNDHTLFLDAYLDRDQIRDNPYAFQTVREAAAALQSGSPQRPMTLLTAPGVYWVDDPEDPAVREGKAGGPFGMTIACDHLHFLGLTGDARNVVFACNRGQTQGANGNFTLFFIDGVGLRSENVTFGNYCNVDLVFPLDERQNRPRRANAIAQAQLFHYPPDDGVAVNTRFVSRLNLCPFPTYSERCHFESSGHATTHKGVYVGCTFDLYNVNFGTGIFLDCDFYLTPFAHNYYGREVYRFGFVDGFGVGGACIDTRFHRGEDLVRRNIPAQISWDKPGALSPATRGYQYQVTLDGQPYVIQNETPGATVVLGPDSPLLRAFKNGAGYCVENLLGRVKTGAAFEAQLLPEGWEPVWYRAERPTVAVDQEPVKVVCRALPYPQEDWTFQVSPPGAVRIDSVGGEAVLTTAYDGDDPVPALLTATSATGLQAALALQVQPRRSGAAAFLERPRIELRAGEAVLVYALDRSGGEKDQSQISWYRCAQGETLPVAVSRFQTPQARYALTQADAGAVLKARIIPQHSRSGPGDAVWVQTEGPVADALCSRERLDTDFSHFPDQPQPKILPGAWTLDGFWDPACVSDDGTPLYQPQAGSWAYALGDDGSRGHWGLDQKARGARLFYTPKAAHGDLSVRVRFAPDKTAGQGFGSATGQFLLVFIGYDLKTRSGYALRIQRLRPEQIRAIGFDGDGSVAGVAFSLERHENGVVTALTRQVMSSAFTTVCTAELRLRQGVLSARVSSDAQARSGDLFGFPRQVELQAEASLSFGSGTGMLFTGTPGSNSVPVLSWQTDWEQ